MHQPPSLVTYVTKPKNVIVIFLAYLCAHFLLRMTFGPVLGLDDSEQTLFAQTWAWSYRFEQPPLFTWLLYPTFEALGVNFISLAIWRYIWLAVILFGSYQLLLKWFEDKSNPDEGQLFAALGAFSLLLIYVIAYFSHHDLTHTTIMTAFIVLGLIQFTRLVALPSALNYVLLGVVFAGGLLGKWNYVVFCISLTIACLCLRDYRHLVLTPKLFLAIGATSLLVLPTLIFVANLEKPYVDIAENALASAKVSSFSAILSKGTGKLVGSMLVYLLPFLLFAGIVFGTSIKKGWQQVEGWKGHFQTTGQSATAISPGFLLVFTLAGFAFLWLLVPTVGAVRFTERWMQPVLYPFPFLVLMWVKMGQPKIHRVFYYLICIAVFSLIAFLARVGMVLFSADHCGSCRALIPFPELTQQIKDEGFEVGTIIVNGFHIGGNMRVAFPESRVIDPHYPLDVWPQNSLNANSQFHGKCLLVWKAKEKGETTPNIFKAYLKNELAATSWRSADKSGVAEALIHGSKKRTYKLNWRLYDAPLGNCY